MTPPGSPFTKKILFLGHGASRSGAPILLLHFLQWLKHNSVVPFEVLLKTGGPLEADFAALAPTTVLQSSGFETALVKICKRLGWKVPARFQLPAKVAAFARERQVGVIYANTVVVAEEVAALASLKLPVVWHVHEMPYAVRCFGGGQPFQDASPLATAFIACSDGVRRGLTEHFSVPAHKIAVIHEFIRPAPMEAATQATHRESVRKELAWPADAFVAGMCGTVEWRKGADWFVSVAKRLATEFPARKIYLLWIGAPDSEQTQVQVDHDLRLAGLTERVRFIGGQADSQRYLAALDAFALTSREDPFPLAMLEAAALAIPMVCFRDSGGGPEFAEQDAGVVVDYADTTGLAEALVRLSEQPVWCRQLGDAARKKVLSRFTVEAQAPKILRVIRETAEKAGGYLNDELFGGPPKRAGGPPALPITGEGDK
jgi:glycosyltransferase involved in cell wall biosynthesis